MFTKESVLILLPDNSTFSVLVSVATRAATLKSSSTLEATRFGGNISFQDAKLPLSDATQKRDRRTQDSPSQLVSDEGSLDSRKLLPTESCWFLNMLLASNLAVVP